MIIKGNLEQIHENSLVGFDAEWTKNYKIKNGNIPFCFSIVTIKKDDLSISNLKEGKIKFNYIQYYCQEREEFAKLVHMADDWSKKILCCLKTCVLCGHQISSDFSVINNIGIAYDIQPMTSLEALRSEWRNRKNYTTLHIFDTRYAINRDFLGKSRRLVDMCNDFWLDVNQPELGNSSMTKLHNTFLSTKNKDICERISVMNLRHSFSAIVLYWLDERINSAKGRQKININKSIYNSLSCDFNWTRSKTFQNLLDNN